jgi:hypothetical protein
MRAHFSAAALVMRIGVAGAVRQAGSAQYHDEAMPLAGLQHQFDVLDARDLLLQARHQPRTRLARNPPGAAIRDHALRVNAAEIGARRDVARLELEPGA